MAPPNTKTFNIIMVVIFIILVSSTTISGFNITRLLDQHSHFSTFNELLSKTGVAEAINKRKTITVLVVANSDLGDLASKPMSSLKAILATHVVLDYYDQMKLQDMSGKSALLTNLYQSSGVANKEQGFLNVTTKRDNIVFGSAIKGAPHDSKMVKTVAAQPYSISVIQISKPIIAPGLDQNAPIGSSPKESPAPESGKSKKGGSDEESESESPTSEEEEAADSPEEEEGESPEEEEADSPSPGSSSSPSPAPGPAKDEKADDEKDPKLAKNNGGSRVAKVGGGALVAGFMGLVSLVL